MYISAKNFNPGKLFTFLSLSLSLLIPIFPTKAFGASSNIIRNYSSGLCVAINSTSEGSSSIQKNCDTTNSTLWQEEIVDKEGSGTAGRAFIRFRNMQTGKCLDLQSNVAMDGIAVVQRTCSSSTSQQWYAGSSNNSYGYYRLFNRSTDKCLDAGGTTAVQQWSCSNANNQHWYF